MSPAERLGSLAQELNAVAAGLWRRDGDQLQQVCFVSGPALPANVGTLFADATRTVPLLNLGLGIVRAAVLGEVTLSIAAELPAESGSGYWLRVFNAACSVAVPIDTGIVSIALVEVPADLNAVVERLRQGIR